MANNDIDVEIKQEQPIEIHLSETGAKGVAGYSDGISGPNFTSPPKNTADVITTWQTGHGWSVTGTGVSSNLNDTTDFVLGSQSAKGTSNGAGAAANMRKTGVANIDVSNKSFKILMKIEGLANLNSLSIYLGNASLANFYLVSIYNPGDGKTIKDNEWTWLEFNFNGAAAPTTSGTPSKTTITDYQIRWTDNNTGNPVTIHFNGLATAYELNPFPNGVVSIQFDDNWLTPYTNAMPILDKYNFPASAMTIVDTVGSANRMSLAQLRELKEKHGWEIAAHANKAVNHNSTFTGISADELDSDLRAMKIWLISNGFGDGDYLAYPQGEYNTAVERVVAKYYSNARTVVPGPTQVLPATNPYRLRSKSVSNTTTTGQIQTLIDNAYNNKNWLILTFHNIVTTPSLSTDFSIANFNTVIDYLATKGIPVKTTGEVMRIATSNQVAANALENKVNKTGEVGMSGGYVITNTATSNALKVDQNGNTSASTSVGGAVLLENTDNTGAGLVAYTNQAASAGHLIVARVDNAAFAHSAAYLEYDGVGSALNILNNGVGSGNTGIGVNSSNIANSAAVLKGVETGRGTLKIEHTGTGTDANASGIAVDLLGSGTAAQGIYVNSSVASGTIGNLLTLRNQTADKFYVDYQGNTVAVGNITITGNIIHTKAINVQTGTAYTAVLTDRSKIITMDNASANTLTLPQNSSVAFPIGTEITVINLGAGTTTVQAGPGATLVGSGSVSSNTRKVITKISTNGWHVD